MAEKRVLHGHIAYASTPNQIEVLENGYILAEDGLIIDICPELPTDWQNIELNDYKQKLIIPGLIDLGLNASLFKVGYRGLDLDNLSRNEQIIWPEMANFADIEYSARIYGAFCQNLLQGFTTRAVISGSINNKSTALLADFLHRSGFCAYIAKPAIDQNCLATLSEGNDAPFTSAAWIIEQMERYPTVKPLLNPYSLLQCSDGLLKAIGDLNSQYHLPILSQIGQSADEYRQIKRLHPKANSTADAFDRFGLLDGSPTLLHYGRHLQPFEQELLFERQVFLAHLPAADLAQGLGFMAIKQLLKQGLRIGLGTAAGTIPNFNMLRSIQDALNISRLIKPLDDDDKPQLSFSEAFYLATKGGGAFFGKIGSFEKGYALDALVIDDSNICPWPLHVVGRLENAIYHAESPNLIAKYINGEQIFSKN